MMVRFQMRKYSYDQSAHKLIGVDTIGLDAPLPAAIEEAIRKGYVLENLGIIPEATNEYSMEQFNYYASAFLNNSIGG